MKAALLGVLMLLALTAGAASGRAGSAGGQVVRLTALESELLAQINTARAERGLHRLALSRRLQASARAHARAMLERGVFQHESPDGTRFGDRIRRFYPSRGFRSWSVGENLLYQTDALSSTEALAAWRSSPPHSRTLFVPAWRDVGIGALWTDSAPGEFVDAAVSVVTVDFGARTG
jgi:uncharacterized protein YkwD